MKSLILILSLFLSSTSLFSQNWQIIDSTNFYFNNRGIGSFGKDNIMISYNYDTATTSAVDIFLSQGLYFSKNGGNSWEKSLVLDWVQGDPLEDIPDDIYDINFSDENTINALDLTGNRIRSTDKGDTWTIEQIIEQENYTENINGHLHFYGDYGISSYNGRPNLYLSDDAGESWYTIPKPSASYNLIDESFDTSFNEGNAFKFGDRIILSSVSVERTKIGTSISEDNGETWTQIIHDNITRRLFMYDGNLGFRVGYVNFAVAGQDQESRDKRGHIMRTRDGGYTWESVFIWDEEIEIRELAFVDENIIVAIAFGFIIKSYDGGDSWDVEDLWSQFPIEKNITVRDITAAGTDVFLINYQTGYILKGDFSPTSVAGETESHHIKIYPNPSNNIINISYPEMKNIIIYNMLGEKVRTYNLLTDELNISTQDLLTGTYFIEIETRDGEVLRQKFVRE